MKLTLTLGQSLSHKSCDENIIFSGNETSYCRQQRLGRKKSCPLLRSQQTEREDLLSLDEWHEASRSQSNLCSAALLKLLAHRPVSHQSILKSSTPLKTDHSAFSVSNPLLVTLWTTFRCTVCSCIEYYTCIYLDNTVLTQTQ